MLRNISSNSIKFPKYASSLVSNDRDEVSRYVTSMSEELKEEYHATMLHDNMYISRLMFHAQ